jgi:hypothetical protein
MGQYRVEGWLLVAGCSRISMMLMSMLVAAHRGRFEIVPLMILISRFVNFQVAKPNRLVHAIKKCAY